MKDTVWVMSPNVPSGALVTVVIPTRNYAAYLPAAVDSVIAQTYREWHCLIVDDGSIDSTPDVARELVERDPRVGYLRQDAHGVSAARNVGWRASEADFIQFLDADDWLAAGKLERQVARLIGDPRIDVVYGDGRAVVDGHGSHEVKLPRTVRPSGHGDALVRALLVSNPMVMCAPLFRRQALNAIGGFDEDVAVNEDWDLLIRLAMSGSRFAFDPDPRTLSFVRLHTSSTSADRLRMIDGAIEMHRRIAGNLTDPRHRAISRSQVDDLRGAASLVMARRGEVGRGLRGLLVAGVRTRRPKWFFWALVQALRAGLAAIRGESVRTCRGRSDTHAGR